MRGNEFDATTTDLRILANLARFHARRSLAAVSYNIFKDTNEPRALEDAVAGERSAIESWRALVAAAGDRYVFDLAMGACNFDLCGHWRDELVKLEADLAGLEQQRRALTVVPATHTSQRARDTRSSDRSAPVVEHERVKSASAGEPLTITARVTDPSGVQSVRLRYRHLTQFEDFATLDMQAAGPGGTYSATVPAAAISPEWDFMYFLEVIDKAGNGGIWPDLLKETPYVVVKVRRK
jgi:hypothetical protein